MLSVILLLFVVSPFYSLPIRLLSSRLTPFNLSESLNFALESVEFHDDITVDSLSGAVEIVLRPSEVVIDYLYDEITSRAVAETAPGLYIRMWGHSVACGYCQAFTRYVKALNFTRVLLVTDSSRDNYAAATAMFEANPDVYRDVFILPTNASLSITLQCVTRTVKPRGINLIALFTDEQTAYHFLTAIITAKLDKPGYAYILSQEAAYFRSLWNGEIGLGASQTLFVADQYGGESSRMAAEGAALRDLLGRIDSQSLPRRYYLYAVSGSQTAVIVKSSEEVDGRLSVFSATGQSLASIATIRASVNYEVVNPDLSIYPLGPQMMRGFQVAFDEANARTDLIPDYFLEDYSVSFTGMAFSYNLSKQRVVAGRNDLGLVLMLPPATHGIIGISNIFSEMNITMPILAGSLSTVLSDLTAYPLYLRPRVENKYLFTIIGRVIRFFGWSHIAVLYAIDNGDFQDGYNQLMRVIDAFGVNVTNAERLRGLPIVLNSGTVGAVNKSLSDIRSSNTRVILVLHSYLFVVMEQMYDLDMRDDYVKLYISGLNDAVFQDVAYIKRRKASKGALMFFPRLFVGALGSRVRQELTSRDGDGVFPNTCFFYDAAYLYFYATDYLLESGYDYEDPYTIVEAMRETHFQGCSGFFKIESGTNDRAASEIVITNFQYNSENDTYQLKEVGAYNPFSAHPYQFTAQIQWPDDQPTFADVKPQYGDCPFLQESVMQSHQAKIVGATLHFALILYSILTAGLLVRRWRHCSVPLLHETSLISSEDLMVLIIVVCDCFQIITLGPKLHNFSHFIAALSANVTIRFDEAQWSQSEAYWVKLFLAFGLIGLLCLLSALKFAGMQVKLGKACCSLDHLIELLIPSVLFIPIVSTLSSVFLCSKGVSSNLSDSFLDKDCYQYCWRGAHLGYAIGSFLGLICYIPTAIYMRPLWQELQPTIHVKVRPMALIVKSALQVTLIVAENTLKSEYETVHACVFFALIFSYLMFMLCYRQSNYDRLNLWQLVATVALLIFSVCSFVSTQTANRYDARLAIAVVLTFGVLILSGELIQHFDPRFASKLTREKSKDLRGLFTFAFTTGKRANEGLEKFYEVNRISAGRNKYQGEVPSEEGLQAVGEGGRIR